MRDGDSMRGVSADAREGRGYGICGVSADAHAGRDWHEWDACALEGSLCSGGCLRIVNKTHSQPYIC